MPPQPPDLEQAARHLERGELDRALARACDAARRQPDSADARVMLTELYLRRGEGLAAYAGLREALKRGAEGFGLLKVMVPAAIVAGDQQTAGQGLAAFQRAPDHLRPKLLVLWAERLEDCYFYEQAVAMLRPLVESARAGYAVLVRYAQLLLKSHRAEEATPVIERALEQDAEGIGAWLARIRQAIQLGAIDDAVDHARSLLKRQPECMPALSMLAEIRPAAISDAHLGTLEAGLRRSDSDYETRGAAGLALARALEAREQFESAFEAYQSGNEALKALAVQRGTDYDPAAVEARVDLLIQRFAGDPSRPRDNAGEGLIFIVGMPRSGTTLLDRMLAAHPKVRSVGENAAMPELARACGMFDSGSSFAETLERDLDSLRQRYLASLGGVPRNGQFVVDKLPLNFWNVGLIGLLFPGAGIIHARRDPMDIALSSYRLRFPETFSWVNDLDDFAHYYLQHRRLMQFWREQYRDALLEFDYERVVAGAEDELRELLDSLSIDWHPDCLEFHRKAGAVYTLSMGQVHQPLYHSAAGRWRRYERQLRPLHERLKQAGALGGWSDA